jgi:hypothetical protein
MTLWAFTVKLSDGSYETRKISVKGRLEDLESFEEEKQRVMERIKHRYERRGKSVTIVNLGVSV